MPGTMHAHASILMLHLSSRPHQIRSAVVAVLSMVIISAHEGKQWEREIQESGTSRQQQVGEEGSDGADSQVS